MNIKHLEMFNTNQLSVKTFKSARTPETFETLNFEVFKC